MIRVILVFIFSFLLFSQGWANNVKVTRDIKIDPNPAGGGNVAVLNFAISWENSWRDDYNWDAVYIFFKFKKTNETVWKHVNIMDQGFHTVDNNYDHWVAKTSTEQNKAQGIFIFRKNNGHGDATTEVSVKWSYIQNGLTKGDFLESNVECSATCIEMVYVPKAAFCIGDGISKNSLRTQYRPILPEWDLIKNDGTIKFMTDGDTETEYYKTYPPENVANRVNETRAIQTNAWCGKAGSNMFTIDFGRNRKIKYIGVSGILNYTNNRPTVWGVYGSKDGDKPWIPLLTNLNQEDWAITPHSYPVAKALKLDETKVDSFRFYRIAIENSPYAPMANNIAMTEVDVEEKTDYAYVIDRQTPIAMNNSTELSADNNPTTWTGTLNQYYPTGYEGFYAMKYEVSQDQYIRFLNKLLYNQQKMRTVGDKLDVIPENGYVYGDGPARRNGIIVGQRGDDAIVFASDYTSKVPSQENDGKTIACNYLSPADMLAYADWAGLRPLSEMEYEKMSRKAFPYTPKLREYAWGTNDATDLRLPLGDGIVNAGTSTEQLAVNGSQKPNANVGNQLKGPVRTGAFAATATTQLESGASFWGIMELTGNLAEIYYTVNQPGRTFNNTQPAHGDGEILPESNGYMGNTDMSTAYWPQTENAFILKGGSFKTEKTQELSVSDRSFGEYFVGKGLNVKDSTLTFRLGHSYTNLVTPPQCTTYLKLNNQQLSEQALSARDSVCNAQTYRIMGSELLFSTSTANGITTDAALDYAGKVDYIWYISEDAGVSWKIIRGEQGQHLTYSNFYNDDNEMKLVYFKRRAVTPTFDCETNPVVLAIINNNYNINRLADTINRSNQTLGFLVETKSNADFTWSWKKPGTSPVVLQGNMKNSRWDYFWAERDNFDNIADSNHILICDMTVLNKCTRRAELTVYVEKREKTVNSNEISMNTKDPKKKCGVVMYDVREAGNPNDDGLYGTVQIGNQCWMAENLRHIVPGYTMFQSLDVKGKDPTGRKRGAMYNWSGAVLASACPEGWRLPFNNDISVLNNTVNSDNQNRTGERLRAGNYWANSPANKEVMGTNTSGFGLIGAGNYNNSNEQTYAFLITADNSGYAYYGYYYQLAYNSLDGLYSPTYWTHHWWGWQPHNYACSYYMPIRCILK